MNDKLTLNILGIHKDRGADWLRRLPQAIAACEARWSLRALPPFATLSHNYVAPAILAGGMPAVLKLGVPSPDFTSEIEALRWFDGHAMVHLLQADATIGAMLLERLTPGAMLSRLGDDDSATSVATQVMRQLWRPGLPSHPFPTVADWASGLPRLRIRFNGGTGPFPARIVDRAERLFAELLASQRAPVLLHGDLHHDNILSAEREPWLVIDPKGVLGEPAFEPAAYLWNHLLDQPDPPKALRRRIDQFTADLGLDRQRIIGWAIAQTVLSAWWSLEDHGVVREKTLACAQLMAAL